MDRPYVTSLVGFFSLLFLPIVQGFDPFVVTNKEGGDFIPKISVDQLSLEIIWERLVILYSVLDPTGPDRFQCNGTEVSIVPKEKEPKAVEVEVELTSEDVPEMCSLNWGDGELFNFTNKEKAQDSHLYQEFDIYNVYIECSHKKKKRLPNVRCPEAITSCFHSNKFFSETFSNIGHPIKFWLSEPIQISAQVNIKQECLENSPIMTWKIAQLTEDSDLEPFEEFVQTNSSDLYIPAGVIFPGLFLVRLEIEFPHIGKSAWMSDYLMITVVIPELSTYILGGTGRTARHGDVEYVNASLSHDPIEGHVFTQNLSMNASWSILVYTPNANVTILKTMTMPWFHVYDYTIVRDGGLTFEITSGTDYVLEFDTSLFSPGDIAMTMFTLERGTRQSSSIHVIEIVGNGLPLQIDCVFNCIYSRERRFNDDRVELDAVIPTSVLQDYSEVIFSWEVFQWFPNNKSYIEVWPSTTSGYATRSLSLPEGALDNLTAYEFSLRVQAPGFEESSAFFMGNIGISPYDGECTFGGNDVQEPVRKAAIEWFEFECTGWMGPDTRVTSNPSLDDNPALTYIIVQITTGAVVPAEPIFFSRSNQASVLLKIGNPAENYTSDIVIRVTDMFNAFVEIAIPVTVLPAFAIDDITPTPAGATIINTFYTEEYLPLSEALRRIGKQDVVITLTSSLTSHLHNIELPPFEMPLPPVLNEGGAILDLKPDGTVEDVGTLTKSLEKANNRTADVATIAIQELVVDLTATIDSAVQQMIATGRTKDKTLLSFLTNANTNLVYKDNFINLKSRYVIIRLAEILGTESMVKSDGIADQSRQLEEASGYVYGLTISVVNTVVSDEHRQFRHVGNFDAGRFQVSDMLRVVGENLSLENSEYTPEERVYLYLQMQRKMHAELNKISDTAKQASAMTGVVMKSVRDGLQLCNTCSNKGSKITKQLVKKGNTDSIQRTWMGTGKSNFNLNGSLYAALGNESGGLVTAISAVELEENVFMYDEDLTSSSVTSPVLRIDVKTDTQEIKPAYMTFTQNVTSPEVVIIQPLIDPDDASELSLHVFVYQVATDYVCLKVKPENERNISEYKIYFNFVKAPTAIEYNFIETVYRDTDWQLYVEPEKMAGHTGLTYLGVFVPGEVKLVKYEFSLTTLACVTWEEELKKWHTDKCLPEWSPLENTVTCTCNNLTDLIFSNTFNPAPNTIDFNTVFLKFSPRDQAAIIGAMGSLFMIFAIAVIVTGGLDRNDLLKWGITPLRDNMIEHKKFYILTVSTGIRRNAGTRSRVTFSLAGTKGSTVNRELFDGARTEFSTGSDMTFLMSTEEDLGNIESLYIWHDNSGGTKFGAWYLNQVVVYDPDRKLAYTFVAEEWLSLATSLELRLYSNVTGTTLPYEHRFCNQTRLGLSERNMWASIFYRPQSSVFTRVQRTACVLIYILFAMLTSAMFYRDDSEYESVAIFKIGPLRFSVEQIYRSFVSALISTPPVMLLTLLFKRTRPKRYDITKERSNRCSCCDNRYNKELRMRIVWSGPPEISGGCYLPHWCLCFVWFLAITALVVPAFFVVLFCIQWGKQKSEEWLTSSLLSIFQSVIVIDPILMVVTAFILSCLFRKTEDTVTYDMDAILQNYKKMFCFENAEAMYMWRTLNRDISSYSAHPPSVRPPPEGQEFEEQAQNYKFNRELSTLSKSFAVNLILVFIVMCVCYTTRDDISFYHHQDISNKIVSPALKITSPQFNYYSITRQGDVFRWLNNSVFPWLFPRTDPAGYPLHWRERLLTTEYTYLRLGPPRLRQLRTKQDSCKIPIIGTLKCYKEYSILSEDDVDYCIGWTAQPCSFENRVLNLTLQAWSFVSAIDVWGFPTIGYMATYGGGGYIAPFHVNFNTSVTILNELFWSRWLDRQTRAVLLEFTLYCAETNLFIYNEFVIEFPETGGAFKSHKIYPLRLYRHLGTLGLFTLVCDALLGVYWLFLMGRIVVKMYEQGKHFFSNVWQVYDAVIVVLIGSTVFCYIVRLLLEMQTLKRFNNDQKAFVNFGHIVFWDNLLATTLGFLAFLVTMRILQVFNTMKKIQAILNVFQSCGRDLVWFGLTFWYFLLAFALCGFLLFGSRLVEFHTAFAGLKTLFLAMIGKSMFAATTEASPIFAQIFFIFYTMCIIFFIFTLFLSILCGGIDTIMHDQRSEQHEDVLDRMIRKVSELINGKQTSSV